MPVRWDGYQVEGTSYPLGWMLKVLKKHDALPFAERDISKVTVTNINDGNGFVSQILRVKFDLSSPGEGEFSVVFKVPDAKLILEAFHEAEQVTADQYGSANYFNREIEFYQAFLPLVNIPLPRIYETILWVPGRESGGLLMEDLSHSCHIQPLTQGLSREQLLCVAGHLADFHNSFLRFSEEHQKLLVKRIGVLEDCIKFRTQLFPVKAVEFKEKYHHLVGDKLSSLIELLKDSNYHQYSSADLCEPFGVPRLPVHGDLWSNNILWKNSNPTEVGAFVDWQGFFIGNPAFDLCRILLLCTSASARRTHTEEVLSHYYNGLQKPGFTLETLRELLRESMPYQCAHMIFVVRLLESSYSKEEMNEMLERVVCAVDDLEGYDVLYKCEKYAI